MAGLNGELRFPTVLRQKKRLEKGDPVKLQGENAEGQLVIYSGVVTGVALDGSSVIVLVRTEEGMTTMTLELGR